MQHHPCTLKEKRKREALKADIRAIKALTILYDYNKVISDEKTLKVSFTGRNVNLHQLGMYMRYININEMARVLHHISTYFTSPVSTAFCYKVLSLR